MPKGQFQTYICKMMPACARMESWLPVAANIANQILPDLRPQDSPPGKRILNAPLEFSPRAHVIMFRCSRYAASHRTHGIRLGFKTVVWISHNGRNGRQPQTSQLHERVDHLLAAGWCAKHPTSWHTRQHPEGLKDWRTCIFSIDFYGFLGFFCTLKTWSILKSNGIDSSQAISSKLARSSNSIPVKWTKKMNTQSDGIKIKRGH